MMSVPRRRGAYDGLPTERRLGASRELERVPTARLLEMMSREDARAVHAVRRRHAQIARAIDHIASALRRGGRLFFVGAGTSGRLGVIEAAECPPTFSTPPAMIQAVIAGGRGAVFRSREGAEDDPRAGQRGIRRRIKSGDVVVGIAASGVTPFVDGALREAGLRRARTILITGNPRTLIPADIRIVLATGPEVLAGSTRLKQATATKLVLNMLTLGAMVRLGKTYGNLMVDVRPSSQKLEARALRLVEQIARCSPARARAALRTSGGRVKPAVLIARCGLTPAQARRRLAQAGGSLRKALQLRQSSGRVTKWRGGQKTKAFRHFATSPLRH